MKLFIKIFIIVFLVEITLGFSMSYIVGINEPNFLFKVIDEIISFPVSIWNRLFPEYGIYSATTSQFWLVIIFNAITQALVILGIRKLLNKSKDI